MGVVGIDRVRNEDICESLGRVAVIGVMNKKEENWKEKLKRMYNALGKQLYEWWCAWEKTKRTTKDETGR